MIEILTEVFTAGEIKTFTMQGKRLELLDCAYPVDVKLMDRSGAELSIMNKSEASFFSQPDGGFETVQITSANAQTVRFFIGSGDAGTRRTSGVVTVVDGGMNRTIADAAFVASSLLSAVAAQYAILTLQNPAGSGVNLVVNALQIGSSAASSLILAYNTLAPVGVLADTPNKKVGSAGVSLAKKYGGNVAAVPADISIAGFQVAAGGTVAMPIHEPFIVTPGLSLIVRNLNIANDLNVYAEFWQSKV